MSQISNNSCSSGPPKKFLKKGEGLKRFAAYKPPLPVTASKLTRRQTFVKFKLEEKLNFIPLEILNDESINLSTEIPKIAPPKIMHTPIRPNRQALGALRPTTLNIYDYDSDETYNQITQNPGCENGTFSRKIATITPTSPSKMISFDGFRKPTTPSPVAQQPKKYNLRGSRKPDADKPQNRRSKRQIKAIVERHISPPPNELNLDTLLQRIEKKKSDLDRENQGDRASPSASEVYHNQDDGDSSSTSGICHNYDDIDTSLTKDTCQHPHISPSSPGSCLIALGQQIQQIETTVNELKNTIKNCQCGSEAPTRIQTRRATRSKASIKTRPSAIADNSTPKILSCLVDEVAQLKARFDEMNFKRH